MRETDRIESSDLQAKSSKLPSGTQFWAKGTWGPGWPMKPTAHLNDSHISSLVGMGIRATYFSYSIGCTWRQGKEGSSVQEFWTVPCSRLISAAAPKREKCSEYASLPIAQFKIGAYPPGTNRIAYWMSVSIMGGHQVAAPG